VYVTAGFRAGSYPLFTVSLNKASTLDAGLFPGPACLNVPKVAPPAAKDSSNRDQRKSEVGWQPWPLAGSHRCARAQAGKAPGWCLPLHARRFGSQGIDLRRLLLQVAIKDKAAAEGAEAGQDGEKEEEEGGGRRSSCIVSSELCRPLASSSW
jgi:hypothetical protein